MAQPTEYDRQNSFTLLAQQDPSDPYTGADLDEEFNAVKVTLDEILVNLALIQRDDGELANQSVGLDQLGASIEVGVNPPEAWLTATAYIVNDTVFETTSLYRCLVAHTSGTFATDLAAAKWVLLADFNSVSIADGAVTEAKIATGAVTAAKIGSAAVTAAKIGTNAVLTEKINDDAVTEAKIGANAVTSDKIQDESVTFAKVQTIATARILGRTTASTGDIEELTAAQATAMLNAVTGDSGSGGVKGLVPAPAAGDAAANKFLKASGAFAVTPAGLKNVQAFTASGTYTPTTGATSAFVIVTGSGGGGGGGDASGEGAGGGAGATAFLFTSSPASTAVTIGAAGAAATTGNSGGAGNTTSFGTTTAEGGAGGGGDGSSGGAGGSTVANATFSVNGGAGSSTPNSPDSRPGTGGASFWGGGGNSGNASKGAGGHGGTSTGNAGGAGLVIVFEF